MIGWGRRKPGMAGAVGRMGGFGRCFRLRYAGGAGLVRKALACLLSVLLVSQPLLVQAQDIRADRDAAAANQPWVGAAGNGVPLVNIVAPDAAGLSRNKFRSYGVGPSGLILNNADGPFLQSQLGGLIQGNGNLAASGPAKVILNEVTGADRSLLQGVTEIGGAAASLVIANPNGMTCDGCGFVNAPRVTLSTGAPVLGADGSLSGLKVEQGDVTVGARGADLGRTGIFDIVSRKISVDGPVQAAGALDLVAGRNSYAYASGQVTPLAADGSPAGIAIDSSLLGGMHAGSIRLIATGTGAGVNMQGAMAANAGAMTLSADGRLTLRRATSKGPLAARSASRTVDVGDTLFSDDAIVLQGGSAVDLADGALVAARGDVTLEAPAVTLGTGAFAASGQNADGSRTATGTLAVRAGTLSAGSAGLSAGGLLSIVAQTVDLSRPVDTGEATLQSTGAITIDAGNVDASNGRIAAGGDLVLGSADALSISGGQFLSAGSLLAEAANLTSSASLAAANEVRLAARAGDIDQAGSVEGNAGTQLTASGNISNAGTVLSPARLSLSAGGAFANTSSGVAAAGDGLSVSAAAIANEGSLSAQGGELALDARGALSNSGSITALSAATIGAGGSIDNSGIAEVEGALLLDATGGLANSGTLDAGSVELGAASLANAGVLASRSGALRIGLPGDLRSSGDISASGDLELGVGGNATLAGRTVAGGRLALAGTDGRSAGDVTVGPGALVDGEAGLDLRAASLANAGVLGSGGGDLAASLAGDLGNDGLIHAAGSAAIATGGQLANAAAGEISAGGDLALSVAGGLANGGDVLAGSALEAMSGGSLSNAAGALMQGGTVTLSAESLANSGTLTAQAGALAAAATGAVVNSGELSATGELSLATPSDLTNTGRLLSAGAMTLSGRDGGSMGAATNTADGLVNGTGGLSLDARSLSNDGGMGSGDGPLLVDLAGDLRNTGLLYSGASALYSLDGDFINTGADVIAGGSLAVRGLSAERAGNLLNISGSIEAGSGGLALSVASLTNRRDGDLAITTQTDAPQVTVDGAVTTTVTTSRERATLGGTAARIVSGGDMRIDTGALANVYSLVSSAGDMTIEAGSVTNEGRDLLETTTTDVATQHSQRVCKLRIIVCLEHDYVYWTTTDSSTGTQSYDAVFGTIEAGGALHADVSGYVANDAVRSGASQTGLASGQSIAPADISGSAPASGMAPADPSSLPGPRAAAPLGQVDVAIASLTGRKAIFEQAAAPDAPYVVETRSQFIDPAKFLGSDYFLDQVGGYRPEASLKRLGDAYFEYRLVEEQIFDQTGRSFLGDSSAPDAMMRALYDNALGEQSALGLAAGVSLTPEQASRLTRDIVWPERRTVDGRQVLVPRLYLAAATAGDLDVASAGIRGGSVGLEAGSFTNSGSVSSGGALALGTSGSLLNDGGGLFAGSDLVIDATGSFTNRSGTVSGGDVSISAASISSGTAVTRDLYANGFADRMQQAARIEAKGSLLLDSAGAIGIAGGRLVFRRRHGSRSRLVRRCGGHRPRARTRRQPCRRPRPGFLAHRHACRARRRRQPRDRCRRRRRAGGRRREGRRRRLRLGRRRCHARLRRGPEGARLLARRRRLPHLHPSRRQRRLEHAAPVHARSRRQPVGRGRPRRRRLRLPADGGNGGGRGRHRHRRRPRHRRGLGRRHAGEPVRFLYAWPAVLIRELRQFP